MIKRCIGCGIKLQTTDENKPGYIPSSKLKDSNLCARCFKINHYNAYDLTSVPKNNTQIIKEVSKHPYQVIFFVDFLNINSETLNTYQKITNPKVLVISKSDLIPHSIKENKIITWLKDYYHLKEDIYFLSTKKSYNYNIIDKFNSSNIYLLGYTNSGKSTFINHLINTKMTSNFQITTSMVPNTTLDFIKIKLSDDLTVIDSPGFTYQNTFYNPNDIELIKKINPKNFISPITYQLKPLMSIVIEKQLVFNFSEMTSITLYLSNLIEIERIYNLRKYQDLKEVQIKVPNNSDIVIKGLGFINVKNACTVTILSNNQDLIEIRDSLFRKD